MEIRKTNENQEIQQQEVSLRSIGVRSLTAGYYGKKQMARAAGGGRSAAMAGIHAAKNILRSKDIRRQLKYLSPEQRKQWNSYSYRKQSQILNKAERVAMKSVEKRSQKSVLSQRQNQKVGAGSPALITKEKALRYELNARAKGSAISNVRGTGDRWQVEVPKGNTARQMKKSMKENRYETVTFYTDHAGRGSRRVKKLENTYKSTVRKEKTEGRVLFLSAFNRMMNEESGKKRQIARQQKEDQITQMEAEHATAASFARYAAMPVKAGLEKRLIQIGSRVMEWIGRLLLGVLRLVLPLLAPVLLFGLLLLVLVNIVSVDDTLSTGGGDSIVQIALKEEGNVNGEKFWRFMSYDYRVAWCACFVSWCGNQLDYQDQDIMPASALCDDFRNFYRSNNRLQPGIAHGGDYRPSPGDLILFQWDGIMDDAVQLDHIGIVVSCDGLNITTIEGNTSNMVAQRSYALVDTAIIWYCIPDYPAGGLGGTGEGGHITDECPYTRQQLELIWAIVAQEDNGSYDGALAVISCAMNRAESARWQNSGKNALEQLTAPGQFCYSNDTYWHKWLGGNVPEYVKQAITDCLEKGIRNHDYTSFRSSKGSETGDDAVQIGGNWYFGPK